jgi:Sec-independent protein translocase protein TatA
VGYFVLGPSDLYKLVKEIGKFIQNARTLGAEAAKSFEGTMEDQLELKELRRAQSELNEAFGFRRSINTSEFGEAFDRTGSLNSSSGGFSASGGGGTAVMAATTATGTTADLSTSSTSEVEVGGEEVDDAPKRKRKLVRRKKKKVVEATEIDVPSEEGGEYNNNFALEYPDLDMLDSVDNGDDDDALLRAQRMERLQQQSSFNKDTEEDQETVDWFTASESDIASEILNQPEDSKTNSVNSSFEKQRFQSQLSAEEWNAQIMAREDELSPREYLSWRKGDRVCADACDIVER